MAQLGFGRLITRSTRSTRSTKSTKSKKKGVVARERSDRGNPIGVKVMVFLIALVFQVLQVSPSAYGWGSITHAAICREAGGSEANIMGGVAPDMIALRSVTTGDKTYDYAHNCYGESMEPVFGNVLTGVSSDDFAAGWRNHQLADSVVHCQGGYSTSKNVFVDLPGKYGNDINHGAVEMVVDAIVLQEMYGGQISLFVPDRSELIHSGAVTYYNRVVGGGREINRDNIISCAAAADMSYGWDNCLQTNILIASMITEEAWFSRVKDQFSDYITPFSRSVNLLSGISCEQKNQTNTLQRLVDAFLPPRTARAAGSGSVSETDSGYYSFLNAVSERACQIGGGTATKESTRQAIEELSGDRSIPAEQQAWAETVDEMTSGNNKNKGELQAKVFGRLARGRDGSDQGASGGHRANLLPYLPCSIALFLAFVIIVWLLQAKRR